MFRRVDPPQAVVVDLGVLFPRQPFHESRYNPDGLQMRARRWTAQLLGYVPGRNVVGAGGVPDRVRGEAADGHPLDTGLDSAQGVSLSTNEDGPPPLTPRRQLDRRLCPRTGSGSANVRTIGLLEVGL